MRSQYGVFRDCSIGKGTYIVQSLFGLDLDDRQ